jgi:hypothetical protein
VLPELVLLKVVQLELVALLVTCQSTKETNNTTRC